MVKVPTLGTSNQQLEIVNLRSSPCSFEEDGVPTTVPGAGRVTFPGVKEHVFTNMDLCSLFLMVGAPPTP